MEYIPGKMKITVVQTKEIWAESDFQKNCQLKEEVLKRAVKNMIIVEKSLLWCTLKYEL